MFAKRIQILFFLFASFHLSAQEIPKVIPYEMENYEAMEQNWAIAQSCEGELFVANSGGILHFNGLEWNLIPFENGRRVRAIEKGKDCRIYCGGYQSFGYLEKRGHQWQYISLSDSIMQGRKEEIWHIFKNEEHLIFQSFSDVYLYDYERLKLLVPEENIMFGASVGDQIIIPEIRDGLLRYENKVFENLALEENWPPDTKITGLAEYQSNTILLATQTKGLFIWKNGQITYPNLPIQALTKANQINRMLRLSSGHYVLGTIQNGIYILSKDLKIEYQINRQLGLTNNTILSLFEDRAGDIWVGTDNGLNLIKWSNPNRYYYDQDDQIGKIFDAIEFEDQLYLGTNKGLFVRQKDGRMKEIPELKGQVWSFLLDSLGLLVGHNDGTFLIKEGQVQQVSEVTGGLQMHYISYDYLLQSTYTGWILLKREGDTWQFAQRVLNSNFSFPNYWLRGQIAYGFNSNEGLIRQKFSIGFERVLTSDIVQAKRASIPANARPQFLELDGQLYTYTENNYFKIEEKNYTSLNLNSLKYNQLKNKISTNQEIIPTNKGYLRNFGNSSTVTDSIFLSYLLINGKHKAYKSQPIRLNARQNQLEIQLGKTSFDEEQNSYQYSINSIENHWTPLPKNGKIRLQDLQSKEYELVLRDGEGQAKNILAFEILPPWYASWWARVLYLLLFVGLAYWLSYFQKKKIIRANEKLLLEKERQLEKERILAKNNELEQTVRHKSQLVANSAMTIIQKNKMLTELKGVVKKALEKDRIASKTQSKVVHMINRNINGDEDWQIFENNFKQIHKDFMDRLRSNYPELTYGDLKLAAYIRMDLQSKEIAPLLNISIRSVENKRSLLRKKLELEHSDNLKEFIINY